jgi:heat shock protein 4
LVRARNFDIKDISQYPIKFVWDPAHTPDPSEKERVIFEACTPVPRSIYVNLERSEPFEVEAHYAETTALPQGTSPWIGRFSIKKILKSGDSKEPTLVKVKTKINESGMLEVLGAQSVEESMVVSDDKASEPTPMETEDEPPFPEVKDGASNGPTPLKRKRKNQRRWSRRPTCP